MVQKGYGVNGSKSNHSKSLDSGRLNHYESFSHSRSNYCEPFNELDTARAIRNSLCDENLTFERGESLFESFRNLDLAMDQAKMESMDTQMDWMHSSREDEELERAKMESMDAMMEDSFLGGCPSGPSSGNEDGAGCSDFDEDMALAIRNSLREAHGLAGPGRCTPPLTENHQCMERLGEDAEANDGEGGEGDESDENSCRALYKGELGDAEGEVLDAECNVRMDDSRHSASSGNVGANDPPGLSSNPGHNCRTRRHTVAGGSGENAGGRTRTAMDQLSRKERRSMIDKSKGGDQPDSSAALVEHVAEPAPNLSRLARRHANQRLERDRQAASLTFGDPAEARGSPPAAGEPSPEEG